MKEKLTPNLDTPQGFTEPLQQCSKVEKDQLIKFYMHNIVTLGPYKWSPNPYVGDFHIRVMASWTNHEILRVEAMTAYQTTKKYSELWIMEESSNLVEVIFNHRILTSEHLIPTLMKKQ